MSSRGCQLCPPPLRFLPPVVAASEPPGHSPPAQEPSAWESARPVGKGFCCRRMKPQPLRLGVGLCLKAHFPSFPDCSTPSDYPGSIPPHKSSSPQGLIPTHLGQAGVLSYPGLCPSQGQVQIFPALFFCPLPTFLFPSPPLSLPLGADEPPSSRAVLGWTGLGARTPESSTEWSVLG